MPAKKSEGQSAIDTLRAKYAKAGMMLSPIVDVAPEPSITSGSMGIDTAIGVGGFPFGRTVELFGPEGSGKSTTAMQVAAELQKVIKAGGDSERGIRATDKIVYFDYEQAVNFQYATALGVDVRHESFLFAQPDELEEGADATLELIATGDVRLVVIDSLAAMVPRGVIDAEIAKRLPAEAARLLSVFGKKLNAIVKKNNAIVIFVNHEMEVMAMGQGGKPNYGPPPTTTPGGKALKYFASLRIQYRPYGFIREEEVDPVTKQTGKVALGRDVLVTVVKNRMGPPQRSSMVRMTFGRGFDDFADALAILTAQKRIMISGGYRYFHNLSEDGLTPEWMPRATGGTQRPYLLGEKAIWSAATAHPEWRLGLIDTAKRIAEEVAASTQAAEPDPEEEPAEFDPQTGEVPEEAGRTWPES